MSVLIKGFDIPQKCYKDIRIHADGSWTAIVETVPYNVINGTVVPVTPHNSPFGLAICSACGHWVGFPRKEFCPYDTCWAEEFFKHDHETEENV